MEWAPGSGAWFPLSHGLGLSLKVSSGSTCISTDIPSAFAAIAAIAAHGNSEYEVRPDDRLGPLPRGGVSGSRSTGQHLYGGYFLSPFKRSGFHVRAG